MENIVKDYFNGNDFAYTVWKDKYALKDENGNLIEKNPDETIRRVAKEFAKVDAELSPDNPLTEDDIYSYFKDFKYIIPGGSVLSGCGSKTPISLSNCFVIDSPEDSYDSIMNTRNKQVQLMKRRGGVGLDLSKLRPRGAKVNNAAITSTGAASFMDGFSAITNEVAQNGRRGALMLTMNIQHPDIEEFISKKQDLTKVTGANISVKVTDAFMKAVENDEDFYLRFPIDLDINGKDIECEYGVLTEVGKKEYVKKVKAKKLWESIVHCAWNTAEPGIIFDDRMHNYAPDSCYDDFRMISTNPCIVGDTKVAVADGRGYVTIKELAEKGDDVPVYCLDNNGKLAVSLMRHPRITGEKEDIFEVELEGGHKIQCTGNHKFLLNKDGYVEVKDLKEGDSLFLLPDDNDVNEHTTIYDSTKVNDIECDELLKEGTLLQLHKAKENGYKAQIIDNEVWVLKTCEICGNTFMTPFEKREVAFCSDSCSVAYMAQRNTKNKFSAKFNGKHQKVMGVKKIGSDTVYNGTVDNYHNFFIGGFEEKVDGNTKYVSVNNLQCGEIGMSGGDSCRLIAINLASFVENPFTPDAKFDYDKLLEVAKVAQRLGDDLVEMEIKAVNRILDTIKPNEETERKVWERAINVGKRGRRTGTGFLGLADAIAMLGLKYDSDEGIEVIEKICKTLFEGELNSTIQLATERGAFSEFEGTKELEASIKGNELFAFIREHYNSLWAGMQVFGRRNISWSTVAPTGTISNLAQTTSGVEPLFFPYYERKKKCMNENDRVDYVDKVGEKFTLYVMVHKGLKDWAHIAKGISYEEMDNFGVEQWKELYEESPYYGSIAPDIDSSKRVQIQSLIQKYITHSISSTCNLCKETTEEEVSNIYFDAWKGGCKGITIYRDGCRENVISAIGKKKEEEKFFSSDIRAPKRPKTLEGDFYTTKVKGEVFYVIVGLYEERPYEIFVYNASKSLENPKTIEYHKGSITKVAKNKYNFVSDLITIQDISSDLTTEELSTALYSSMLLRHGAGLKYIIKTARKVDDNILSFTSAMTRILSKYLPKETLDEVCPECGGKLVREGGCIHCTDCTWSRCS